jgi:large subunit ribosomal protein L29
MNPNQFRDMTPEELGKKILSLKEDLFSHRFRLGTGQLENTHRIKQTKKDIARALTVARQFDLKEQGK